jgi:hypothetical protein
MKVIVSTPRSASTFYARYLWATHPTFSCLDEYFQPLLYPNNKHEFDITSDRLSNLKGDIIVKILAGKDTDIRVWKFLEKNQIPITFLRRKNLKRQFLSFGVSCINDIWVKFNEVSSGINRRDILNKDLVYKKGYYERKWFDGLVYRIKQLNYLQTILNTKEILFYEDIINLKFNISAEFENKIPIKQNNFSDNEMFNFFTNKEELSIWIDTFIEEINRDQAPLC